MSEETPAPEYPFPWMPLAAGNVELVGHDGFSYVDRDGRTYWSGTEPSAEDAADAVANPRTVPAPVPQSLTPAQFMVALRKVLGISEGTIYTIISGLPDQEQQEDARDLFERAQSFRRDNPILAVLAAANGNTSEEIDNVFRVGATLFND